MPTTAETFGITRGNLHEPRPINIQTPLPHSIDGSNDNHKEEMPPTRRHEDDDATLRENLNIYVLASTQLCKAIEAQTAAQAATGNGEKRRMSWFMASIAVITILGAGGNFIGNSGIWVGNRNRDAEEMKVMKDRLENLRTLYLIRFGEDPDKVTPETMNRRLKTSQEK